MGIYRLAAIAPDWPGNFWWHLIILTVILIGLLLSCVIIFIWMERRVIGRFQARLGPNARRAFRAFPVFCRCH